MITRQEAKEFLRVDGDDEENLIASLIVAAQELTEDVLRRPLAEIEPLPETVRGFDMIVRGEVDDLPEAAFYNVGTIDDAIAKAKRIREENAQ